jgi:hypothetical protein
MEHDTTSFNPHIGDGDDFFDTLEHMMWTCDALILRDKGDEMYRILHRNTRKNAMKNPEFLSYLKFFQFNSEVEGNWLTLPQMLRIMADRIEKRMNEVDMSKVALQK